MLGRGIGEVKRGFHLHGAWESNVVLLDRPVGQFNLPTAAAESVSDEKALSVRWRIGHQGGQIVCVQVFDEKAAGRGGSALLFNLVPQVDEVAKKGVDAHRVL